MAYAPLRSVFTALLGLALVSPTNEATADTQPNRSAEASDVEFKELVRNGIAAYRSKDYAAARTALTSAIQINADSLAIGLLADTEMKLKLYRDAAEHWSIYLRASAAEDSSDRAQALEQLELCRKHVGSVIAQVQPLNAELTVDGRVVDHTLTKGELWFEPGTYELQAKSGSEASVLQAVTIRPGDALTLTLTVPVPPPQPAPIQPSSPDVQLIPVQVAPRAIDRRTPTRTYVLISEAALTLAAAGVGTAYWILNGSAKRDADSASQTLAEQTNRGICAEANAPDACGALRSANDQMKRTADIAQVSFIAAGVLGAATIGTYLLWRPRREPTQDATLTFVPYWSPANQGVAARIRF